MWILLWLVLSVFVLGVFVWSMAILQQQKKAWYAFAKKAGLTYRAGKYTDAPVVTGMVKQFKVTFFTDSLRTKDVRGRRFITTIEVEMGDGMPTMAVLATKDYADFLAPLRLPQTYEPPGTTWGKDFVVRAKSRDFLAAYLTPERVKVLAGLFSMKNSSSIFFFDQLDSILRIETPDPLRDAGKMEKIFRRILTVAEGLVLTAEEKKAFGPHIPEAPAAPPAIATAASANPPEAAPPVAAAEKPAAESGEKPQAAPGDAQK
jgi:hypothetical protein